MKEKKFFCDRLDNVISKPIFIILLIALLIMSCIISYNICNNKFLKEISQYSESDYEYLVTLADSICDEDSKSINTSNVPDNVQITDIKYTKEQITFKCILDKNFIFAINPQVFVTISNNFDDVKVTIPSKEIATDSFITVLLSICFGLLAVLIPMILILLPLWIISIISSFRKELYYVNNIANFKEEFKTTIRSDE